VRRDNPSILVPLADRAEVFAGAASFTAVKGSDTDPVPPRAGDVALIDNVLRTASAMPLVLIETPANVTLAQNRIARESKLVGTPAVIARAAGATIVSSNRVETAGGTDGARPSVALFVGSPADNEIPHCTVLGNISSQPIWLNGAPLTGPWAPLNIVA
jgi:hypothetical protein